MALYNFLHTGIYRFQSNAYSGYSLNAYTSGAASNGTNVCLFPSSSSDTAQQWRVIYAGNDGTNKPLFFLNLIANGTGYGNNMALDRNTAATNKNNAQTYTSVSPTLAGNDQLVYFTDRGTNLVSIRLFSDNRALTANAPGTTTNGTSNGSSTAAANVHWATYNSSSSNQIWRVVAHNTSSGVSISNLNSVTKFPASAYYNASNNSNFPQYLGECVWYVKGRYKEVKGVKCPYNGNANAFYGQAASNNKSSSDAKAGSIACWNGGGYGHVAFVESVDSTGTKITYSQANWDSGATLSNGQPQIAPAGTDGKLVVEINKTKFEDMHSGFQGYIHR